MVCKKGYAALPGYDLSYSAGGDVGPTVCDKRLELDRDAGYWAAGIVRENAWNYVAVSYRHKEKQIVFYKDGAAVKSCAVSAGDMSNQDMFSIGWNEYTPNSQAHCMIRDCADLEVRPGLPDDLATILAWHNQNSQSVSDKLTAAGNYSRWSFEAANDDIQDLGNNGNTLCEPPRATRKGRKYCPYPQSRRAGPSMSIMGKRSRHTPFCRSKGRHTECAYYFSR